MMPKLKEKGTTNEDKNYKEIMPKGDFTKTSVFLRKNNVSS